MSCLWQFLSLGRPWEAPEKIAIWPDAEIVAHRRAVECRKLGNKWFFMCSLSHFLLPSPYFVMLKGTNRTVQHVPCIDTHRRSKHQSILHPPFVGGYSSKDLHYLNFSPNPLTYPVYYRTNAVIFCSPLSILSIFRLVVPKHTEIKTKRK